MLPRETITSGPPGGESQERVLYGSGQREGTCRSGKGGVLIVTRYRYHALTGQYLVDL